MPVEIEARVYDTRNGECVGVIVTDAIKIACYDASGSLDDHVLGCIASFVHQYRCNRNRATNVRAPYSQTLYEALLQINVSSDPWRIVTNIT